MLAERVMKVHGRSVNRISWHLDNPFTLISGSQDTTVKLWVRALLEPAQLCDASHLTSSAGHWLRSTGHAVWVRDVVRPEIAGGPRR